MGPELKTQAGSLSLIPPPLRKATEQVVTPAAANSQGHRPPTPTAGVSPVPLAQGQGGGQLGRGPSDPHPTPGLLRLPPACRAWVPRGLALPTADQWGGRGSRTPMVGDAQRQPRAAQVRLGAPAGCGQVPHECSEQLLEEGELRRDHWPKPDPPLSG